MLWGKMDNLIQVNKDININNKAFCFNCRANINLDNNPDCKNHNIKYLNESLKDININQIEENWKTAIEYYEETYKKIKEKSERFKQRYEKQILLAKKIIEIYKNNINNLNYQIIMNTKNILHFNQIKFKDFKGYNFSFIPEKNILKEYSLNNYIDEKLVIHSIQKNSEIKNCCG